MIFNTDYRLEKFILDTRWEDLPLCVKERVRGCFLDLLGALLIGAHSEQFEAGLRLAKTLYGTGDIPVIGSDETFSFMGASCAMGHSSNAYDIDDGHNIIRAHPGTSFIGGILAAAYEKNLTRNEFFTALVVAYEACIRSGEAIMDYYKYAHSSGTFGAVGVAAGVGRIYGFSKEELNNVLSVAEFNAPLVPGIRSVEYPSMNKDGVPFGVMIGTLAVMASKSGFQGNKNLLEADEFKHYLDDLGENWEIMKLYFKPYTCCRWGHPAIDACIGLLNEHGIQSEDIEKVTIKTFYKATQLSKIVPKTADEAQYNIAYPVAAALIYKDFGYAQVCKENLGEARVVEMMKKLSFETDPALDAQFPAKRICRAEIVTRDGRTLISPECEPRGEAHENIGFPWLADKFRRIASPVFTDEGIQTAIDLISSDEDLPLRELVDTVNQAKFRK